MDFLAYPLALIVTLGLLVAFHEFGHYLVARWSGVKILRFSVGMGKPLLTRVDSRGTEFVISALPLGGYLRMYDERDPSFGPGTDQPLAPGEIGFGQLSPWWRIAIALGGPVANFLLAIIVYWFLFLAGTTSVAPSLGVAPEGTPAALAGLPAPTQVREIDGAATLSWQNISMALAGRLGDSGTIELGYSLPGESRISRLQLPIQNWHRGVDEPDLLASLGLQQTVLATLGDVVAESPAATAGLQSGDHILAIDGEPIADWFAFVKVIQGALDKPLAMRVLRDGSEISRTVTPKGSPADASQGFLGVSPIYNHIQHGPVAALSAGVERTAEVTGLTLGLLKKMVTGDVSMKNLSGPITIAQVAGDSAKSGWRVFLSVIALLSVSLGVLNLLPIPILDGGNIMFQVGELLMGRPVSERAQILGTQVGLVMVGGLMLLAIFNDITRLL